MVIGGIIEMTRLERNAQMVDVLWHLRKAYRSGDFSEFVSRLSEDCVYESMWVLEPLRGKGAVSNHLIGKGKSIKVGWFLHSLNMPQISLEHFFTSDHMRSSSL